MNELFRSIFILTFFICTIGCDPDNGKCEEPPLSQSKVGITLLEEDSQQVLISDRLSGGIYHPDSVVVYFNGLVKEGAVNLSGSIFFDDWDDPVILDSLIKLTYFIDLPDSDFPTGFEQDTCTLEYIAFDPMCDNNYHTERLEYLKITYNDLVVYEGKERFTVAVRLDRI